jgi:hypothetical protein
MSDWLSHLAYSIFELIKLLKKDGWIEHRQAAHGIVLIYMLLKNSKMAEDSNQS